METLIGFVGLAYLSGVITGSTVTFWLLYLTNEINTDGHGTD